MAARTERTHASDKSVFTLKKPTASASQLRPFSRAAEKCSAAVRAAAGRHLLPLSFSACSANRTELTGVVSVSISLLLLVSRLQPSWNVGGGDRSSRQMVNDSASGDCEPLTQLLPREILCFGLGLKGAG